MESAEKGCLKQFNHLSLFNNKINGVNENQNDAAKPACHAHLILIIQLLYILLFILPSLLELIETDQLRQWN